MRIEDDPTLPTDAMPQVIHQNGKHPQPETVEDTLARLQRERAIIRWARDKQTGEHRPVAVTADALRLHPKDRPPNRQNGKNPH